MSKIETAKQAFTEALEDSGTKPYWKYLFWGYIAVALLDRIF